MVAQLRADKLNPREPVRLRDHREGGAALHRFLEFEAALAGRIGKSLDFSVEKEAPAIKIAL